MCHPIHSFTQVGFSSLLFYRTSASVISCRHPGVRNRKRMHDIHDTFSYECHSMSISYGPKSTVTWSTGLLLGRPTGMSEGIKLNSWTFFINTPRSSSRAVDGHQLYFVGSVIVKASLIDPEISPTPPLIFAGGVASKMAKFNIVFNITQLNFEPIPELWKKFDQQLLLFYVNATFGKVGSTHPWEPFGKSALSPKIARRKRAKSSIPQPWIIRFRSNFVQSLNTWHPKCSESSRSRGQRSRLQCDITYQRQKTLSFSHG